MLHYLRAIIPQDLSLLTRDNFDLFPKPELLDDISLLLILHNKYRNVKYPLSLNNKLIKSAQQHAEWMAKNNILDHYENGISNIDRARSVGYNSYYVGENIAEGTTTPAKTMQLWMKSYWHKVNILNYYYKDVGFGVAKATNGITYWCTDFGAIF
jgi:uncharacterized protein YkwD